MPLDGGDRTPNEESDKKFIAFGRWGTMDTQSSRIALDIDRPAWLENLQQVGVNALVEVPGPAVPKTTIAGETVVREFYAAYGTPTVVDYIIVFCASGSAYQVNVSTGATVKFAVAGTFSGTSDCTQWGTQRILIADPTAGYCTWDGVAFVRQGGVSPNINVTNGGSGYIIPPAVTIVGGSGVGATATATIVGGVVTSVQLTNAGSGYVATDLLTVTFSTGAATANARVWPFITGPVVSLAVYQGRVWLVGGLTLQWTGTGLSTGGVSYDDVNAADAAGQRTFSDSDIVHFFTVVRALNNYLYIFGDNSVRQIGTIQVQSGQTVFSPTTLTSDQGTTFLQSVISYNRLVIFCNQVGVWAIYGASVEKISDPMDGIFSQVDFTQGMIAVTCDVNKIRTLMVLVRYADPLLGITRSIFMSLMNKKWFIISQGNSIKAAACAILGGSMQVFASSGNDITPILASTTTAVAWLLRTALSDNKTPQMGKRTMRIGIAHSAKVVTAVTLTSDSENFTLSSAYTLAFGVIWLNAAQGVVTWVNSLNQVVTFVGAGFQFQPSQAQASGIYLGASISATSTGMTVNGLVIEYQEAAAMRSRNHL